MLRSYDVVRTLYDGPGVKVPCENVSDVRVACVDNDTRVTDTTYDRVAPSDVRVSVSVMSFRPTLTGCIAVVSRSFLLRDDVDVDVVISRRRPLAPTATTPTETVVSEGVSVA